MSRKRFRIFQNYRANKLLASHKRAIDAQRRDFRPTIGALPAAFGSEQTQLGRSNAIEMELRRNTAVMYANTIPPR